MGLFGCHFGLQQKWNQLFREMTSERGAWSSGPTPEDAPKRWKLDSMEDPLRRRLRLRPNYRFDEQLLLRPSAAVTDAHTLHTPESPSSGAQNGMDAFGGHALGSPLSDSNHALLLRGLRGVSHLASLEGSEDADGEEEEGIENDALEEAAVRAQVEGEGEEEGDAGREDTPGYTNGMPQEKSPTAMLNPEDDTQVGSLLGQSAVRCFVLSALCHWCARSVL